MRELETEELEQHVGGLNDDYQGTVIHDPGGDADVCGPIWRRCTNGQRNSCLLFNDICV
ncbi:hypothetical protein [Bacillus pseudomycoides]